MPSDPRLRILRLPHGADLPLPHYASEGAAGMDVVAAVDAPLLLAPGARAAVPTGLAMAIPDGFEVQVRPRSGLALKQGLTVANAPGTIDCDVSRRSEGAAAQPRPRVRRRSRAACALRSWWWRLSRAQHLLRWTGWTTRRAGMAASAPQAFDLAQ